MATSALLIDAAVARDTAAVSWLDQPTAINLYADMPSEAASVAPWLVPEQTLEALGTLPLPTRYGFSHIASDASLDEVAAHLRQLRHLQTSDGQWFYFRFADTRVLKACQRAWPQPMRARVKGPITRWTWYDRRSVLSSFASEVAGVRGPLGALSLAQFQALIDAGAADRMANALEELRQAGLHPVQNADQFDHVEAAVAFMGAEPPYGWTVQRAIARQAVLTRGRALGDAAFHALLADKPPAEAIDAWHLGGPTGNAE